MDSGDWSWTYSEIALGAGILDAARESSADSLGDGMLAPGAWKRRTTRKGAGDGVLLLQGAGNGLLLLVEGVDSKRGPVVAGVPGLTGVPMQRARDGVLVLGLLQDQRQRAGNRPHEGLLLLVCVTLDFEGHGGSVSNRHLGGSGEEGNEYGVRCWYGCWHGELVTMSGMRWQKRNGWRW